MTSEEITATVDPTIFASIMEKTSFSFSISISNVTTNDKNTVISSSLSTLPVIINKAAYCNLKSGIPSNSPHVPIKWSDTISIIKVKNIGNLVFDDINLGFKK